MAKRVSGTREWSTRSANLQIGCENDCHYCLHPDTLILMADGTHRKIRALRVGDKIIGVKRRSRSTRYAEATVTNVWTKAVSKFTIYLKNGMQLQCSADHKWLTYRGWKETAKRWLTMYKHRPLHEYWRKVITKNTLRSIGKAVETPEETKPYKAGYLYGAMRGDGTHGRYDYRKKKGGHKHGPIIRTVRIVNIDPEIGQTTKRYLADVLNIETRDYECLDKNSYMYGVRSGKKRDHHRLSFFLTRFNPCEEQRKHPERMRERSRGFLAGIFDAEGSSSKTSSVIRISNSNEDILGKIEKSLDNLGFKHVRDVVNKNGCLSVRIRGGISEYIRFFSTVNPKIRRKFRLVGKGIRGSIGIKRVSKKSPKSELMYDIETTTHNFIANGCISHNCYARYNAVHRFETVRSAEEWKHPKVDPNLVNKKWRKVPGKIMFPTQHDIDPGNLNFCLTALTNMLEAGNEVLIVSKPRVRCVERMCEALGKWKDNIMFRFTITAMDDSVLGYWEPGAPSYAERLESLKCAFGNGYKTSVSCEPCLDVPGFIVLFRVLEPWVTDGIWLGMMNRIDQRVAVKTDEDRDMVRWMKSMQAKENYQMIHEQLKGDPKIRWKGEVREILGLPLMESAGEDR